IETHEIRRKREAGLPGTRRGQQAAALDAVGAALGAFGMLAFAIVFSLTVKISISAAFIGASLAWLAVSVAAWYVRRKTRLVRRASVTDRASGSALSQSPEALSARDDDPRDPPDGRPMRQRSTERRVSSRRVTESTNQR